MADTQLLEKCIKDSGLKISFICDKIGITRQAFNNKKNGKSKFRQSEIYVLRDLLDLSNEDCVSIFFT